jgi:hypothetical protein
MRVLGRLRIAAAVALCSGGCAPAIHSFTLAPQVLCAGDTATAAWDARGTTTLEIAPETSPPATDGCAVRGRTTTAYTLIARRNGEDARSVLEVLQLSDGAAEPVAFPTGRLEAINVIADGAKAPALWNDQVRVATVAACANRVITVTHEGHTAILPADGKASPAFDGTALGGHWSLSSPLTPGEQHDPASRPSQLEVVTTLHCVKGNP